MTIRHLLSLAELGPQNLSHLVNQSFAYATAREEPANPLAGKIVGIYFRGPSTRTRTSFTVGAIRLGAQTVSYGPHDLQIATGETLHDTARVLSGFLDVLVIRTNQGIDEMKELAEQNKMAIINAMSENEHPTQAIADLSTIREAFGRLDDVHVLYLGEGNNSAAALALAISQTPGMRLTLVTPEGYGLAEDVLETAHRLAAKHDSVIEHHHRIDYLPTDVDAVYATRWQTMGETKTDPHWLEKFAPYSVTTTLMAKVSKSSATIFLHDLPAVRGQDVQDEVLDGAQSRAFRQAQHKLYSAMAVLRWCLAGEEAMQIARHA